MLGMRVLKGSNVDALLLWSHIHKDLRLKSSLQIPTFPWICRYAIWIQPVAEVPAGGFPSRLGPGAKLSLTWQGI